jgi:hypothetical protein
MHTVNAELVESLQHFITIWRLIGKPFPQVDATDRPGLAISWRSTHMDLSRTKAISQYRPQRQSSTQAASFCSWWQRRQMHGAKAMGKQWCVMPYKKPTRRPASDGLHVGISRFPREVSTNVHGVSDRAGLWRASRFRRSRWSLPLSPTASASRSDFLTRLNTRPARSPVNASTPPLRVAPHDSGPMWVATSHSYDFCIHYTSPVLTGAQSE